MCPSEPNTTDALVRRLPESPLSPRLTVLADRVLQDRPMADIGTDHAWLPLHLVATGVVPNAIAGDINEPPLKAARQRISAHGWSDRVMVRQGDGLAVLAPFEVATVTIAGMGGRRIVDVVARAVTVAQALGRLIVQPNTDVPFVRSGLRALGLRLVDEDVRFLDGHFFTTLVWEPGTVAEAWSPLDVRYGPLLRQAPSDGYRQFIASEQTRLASSVQRARDGGASAAALAPLFAELADANAEWARISVM